MITNVVPQVQPRPIVVNLPDPTNNFIATYPLQFPSMIVPTVPEQTKETIYPNLEGVQLIKLEKQLYQIALQTGYVGSFKEFTNALGQFLNEVHTSTDIELYTGQYEVTPMVEIAQLLRTKGKLATDDIIVHAIPYYETTNDAGGYTVIIG